MADQSIGNDPQISDAQLIEYIGNLSSGINARISLTDLQDTLEFSSSNLTDFDDEVGNHPDVVANTAKISFDSVSSDKLDTIEVDAKDDQEASEVPFSSSEGLSAVDVSAGINENTALINAGLLLKANDAEYQAHASSASIHSGLDDSAPSLTTLYSGNKIESIIASAIVGTTDMDLMNEGSTNKILSAYNKVTLDSVLHDPVTFEATVDSDYSGTPNPLLIPNVGYVNGLTSIKSFSIIGVYDANTNSPDLFGNSYKEGNAFEVSIAGTLGGKALKVGDVLISKVDNPAFATDYMQMKTSGDIDTSEVTGIDAYISANTDVASNTSKLAGIEANAKDDQSAGEIESLYEGLSGTEKFTSAEKTKLANLNEGFLGWFADDTALIAAHPTGSSGQFALLGSTDTNWAWDSDTTAWINTLGTSSGDMLKTIYDPTSVNGDSFLMSNMAETATEKVLTAIERTAIATLTGKYLLTDTAGDAVLPSGDLSVSLGDVNVALGSINIVSGNLAVNTAGIIAASDIVSSGGNLIASTGYARAPKIGIGKVPVEELDMVGNIALTGTVDGRDIAGDGLVTDDLERLGGKSSYTVSDPVPATINVSDSKLISIVWDDNFTLGFTGGDQFDEVVVVLKHDSFNPSKTVSFGASINNNSRTVKDSTASSVVTVLRFVKDFIWELVEVTNPFEDASPTAGVEGTFTPRLADETLGTTAPVYVTQDGIDQVKEGWCKFSFELEISSKGTLSNGNDSFILDMPEIALKDTPVYIGELNGVASGNHFVTGYIEAGTTTLHLRDSYPNAATPLNMSFIQSYFKVLISGEYKIQ